MTVDLDTIPTPIAQCIARLRRSVDGRDLYDASLITFEVFLKLTTCILVSALYTYDTDHAYELEFKMSRATSPGAWHACMTKAVSALRTHSVPDWLFAILRTATKKYKEKHRPEWFSNLYDRCHILQTRLKEDGDDVHFDLDTVDNVIGFLVYLRNKTRAHGAKPDSFYLQYDKLVKNIIFDLIEACFLLNVNLRARMASRLNDCLILRGPMPNMRAQAPIDIDGDEYSGIFVETGPEMAPFFICPCMIFDPDNNWVWFANSAFNISTSKIEFINYFDGKVRNVLIPKYAVDPVPRPNRISAVIGFPHRPKWTGPVFMQQHLASAIVELRRQIEGSPWERFSLTDANIGRIPLVGGVYCLVSHAHAAGIEAHKIIGYVGKATMLRERFNDYMLEKKSEAGRSRIKDFLNVFPNVYFWYTVVRLDQDRDNLEGWLIKAIDPPANTRLRLSRTHAKDRSPEED